MSLLIRHDQMLIKHQEAFVSLHHSSITDVNLTLEIPGIPHIPDIIYLMR